MFILKNYGNWFDFCIFWGGSLDHNQVIHGISCRPPSSLPWPNHAFRACNQNCGAKKWIGNEFCGSIYVKVSLERCSNLLKSVWNSEAEPVSNILSSYLSISISWTSKGQEKTSTSLPCALPAPAAGADDTLRLAFRGKRLNQNEEYMASQRM